MSSDSNLNTKFPLWAPRPVEETLDIYANWAASYDDDLAEAGYETPHRIAAALAKFTTPDARILDFGCGTGLSGRLCRWLDSQTWTASIFPLQCSTKRKSEIFTAGYGKASRAK